MFRKVQLKFFGIITAILIAIFIGVLSSVNIIMNALMEHQTKVVLEQVASGVEYNTETASFTFKNPNPVPKEKRDDKIPDYRENERATTASSEAASAQTSTASATTAVRSVSTGVQTDSATVSDEKKPAVSSAVSTEAPTSPPSENTKPASPERPAESSVPPETRQPHEPWDMDKPPFPDKPEYDPNQDDQDDWGDNWGGEHWDDDYWNDGRWHPERNDFHDDIEQTANDETLPVLDGFTIDDSENPPPIPPEGIYDMNGHEPVPRSIDSVNFFVIMADDNGKYLSSEGNDDLTEETAQNYIDTILSHKKSIGMTDNFSYCTEKKSNGTLMVLTDRTAEINIMNKLKRTTFFIGVVSIIVLSAAAYFLSGLIVKPIKDTFEKQKQFISDASHELKTPLTVISTNADVLYGEIGGNKWLTYIQDQISRMNILVNDLLDLSRLENKTSNFITAEFDLSQAVTNTALPFECQAFESNKNFVLNIDDGITVRGSERHIKQMTGIFIDNALKYSKDGGTVRISLSQDGGKAVLSVYNTGPGIKDSEKNRLFERFYRSDESRNRTTGGYGLGLAIAKSIIDKHKFKVAVENDEGRSICFVVTMPQ